jgi:hypothetical protein
MLIADVVSLEREVLRWRGRTIILFEMFWQNEAKKLNIFWGCGGGSGPVCARCAGSAQTPGAKAPFLYWQPTTTRDGRYVFGVEADLAGTNTNSLLAAHNDSRRPLCLWCRGRSGRDQHERRHRLRATCASSTLPVLGDRANVSNDLQCQRLDRDCDRTSGLYLEACIVLHEGWRCLD